MALDFDVGSNPGSEMKSESGFVTFSVQNYKKVKYFFRAIMIKLLHALGYNKNVFSFIVPAYLVGGFLPTVSNPTLLINRNLLLTL